MTLAAEPSPSWSSSCLQTPNVQTLHLLADENKTTFSDLTVISSTAPSGFYLSALTTLSIGAHPRVPSDWEDPFHFDCQFLLRLLPGLPRLARLRLHRAQCLLPYQLAIRKSQIPLMLTPFASITSLNISHSRYMPFDFVIHACDRLEVFKMIFGDKFNRLYSDLRDVLRGLQRHKSSLHTFVFGGRIHLDAPDLETHETPSFRDFTKLHSIIIVPFITTPTGNPS